MKFLKVSKNIAVPVLLPLLIYVIWNGPQLFQLADLAWRDFLYTVNTSNEETEDVVIVAIDEPSFQQIEIRWPWPRSLHAEVVDALNQAGAHAIVFDIIFPEKSPDSKDDRKLAKSFNQAGNVVIGANLAKTNRKGYEHIFVEEPIPVLKNSAAKAGMVNLKPDIDGTIRKGSLKIYGRSALAPAAVEIAGDYSDLEKYKDKFDSRNSNRFHIDFGGNAGTLPKVSYYQVLHNMVNLSLFKDKIVLIGFHMDTSVDLQSGADAYPTPFLRLTKKMMFGVEIQANIIRTIINEYPIKVFGSPVKFLFFWVLAAALFFVRTKPVLLLLGVFIGISIPAVLSVLSFSIGGTIVDILPGVAGVTTNGLFLGVNEFRVSYMEKLKLRKAFSSYVAPELVDQITKNYDSLKLGGEQKELSVLFSDIRNFTGISEKMAARDLVTFLNSYFKEITTTVYNNHGTLDKYIGDAVMVIFGAPVSMENHADQACRTALEMNECVKKMNRDRILGESFDLQTGIGITTGEMIVGNLGSSLRFSYTAIGDDVNLSARLEGVTKIYKVPIIVNEATKNSLKGDFFLRELDIIRVKGKESRIKIYELISEGRLEEKRKTVIDTFEKGLKAYREQKWNASIELFTQVLKYDPDDGPAGIFLDRCVRIFRENPPPEDWDGVWEMETK